MPQSKVPASRTLAEETYRRLRGDIIWGVLEPNAALPSTELCDAYGVGISPLREALSRLVAEHLVTSIEHRGFRVAPISVEDVVGTMEARILIESDALRRSIKYGDVAWEARIVAALHSLQRAPIPTGPGELAEAWAEAHREYHAALIGACNVAWLMKLAGLLFPQAERHRIYQARVEGPALLRDRPTEHDVLAKATIERNVTKAVRTLEEHYRYTADSVVRALATEAAPAV